MDGLIMAAARALASGDPLGALGRVALRDDAPALALRGIALAQLGDVARARVLVRRAARAFGATEPVARARCVVAEAEIALAARDLGWPSAALDAARDTLARHGDVRNAAYAAYLAGRRLVLIGHLGPAEKLLAELDPASFPPALRAVHELTLAGIALRRVQAGAARAALARAGQAAAQAGIPALQAEVRQAHAQLEAPAPRLDMAGQTRELRLAQVEALLASDLLVIDACRYAVHGAGVTVSLASRPVLFTLAQALGQAWPGDAPREALISQAFRSRHPDETHRARLRVEIGRLRATLGPLAQIRATRQGFALTPPPDCAVAVLAPPVRERHAAVLALLADGQAWSSSALALATGTSQRQMQRALEALAAGGRAQPFGHGRARRWITPPLPGFATTLLLPLPPPDA
ncbi:hypothetical protein LMG26788_00160 [Achromobacter pulmonis]|uniref:Helix-turn-helix domain-containing protein n=1 Tax=Achromobacter pulmonis TaxID=1389932 RepID=A0A6S7BUH5_9BURK|nr:helix-turn-helix domain-containing protein [Achromobacter pulmonis]CAB3818871.1 hypothetical protein LMG26788_00160 [Achromobacter pulmonis]